MKIRLEDLKKHNQDYEFYPTTKKMLAIVRDRIRDNVSVLDVGAGDGKALEYLTEGKRYAIEKSKILVDSMDPSIFVIGTDFHQQTFIDKNVDVIFCNPPYSEFVEWSGKLILEANCKTMFLVIPERWKDNPEIKQDLEIRGVTPRVIGSDTFENSEDRKARAKVDILAISFDSYNVKDPFRLWFDKYFPVKEDTEDTKEKQQERFKGLVKKDLVKNLVLFYESDRKKLLDNYKSVCSLDGSLLKELQISKNGLREGLEGKIKGLKSLYWDQLFNHLDAITNRLTAKSRKSMLETLTANTSVDFTESNIYSVVIWAVKNANKYFDSQMVEVYKTLSRKENIQNYKSNHRLIDDYFRYRSLKEDAKNYKLDYRLIHEMYNVLDVCDWRSYEYVGGLSRTAHEFIGDLITLANNLGFSVINDTESRTWKAGKKEIFYSGKELFAEIKVYKNGNIHFKMSQKFMKKFNIEVARILKWVRGPEEAARELEISLSEAKEMYGSNLTLLPNQVLMIEE